RQMCIRDRTYSDIERDLVYKALTYTALKLYSNGHNVLIDATANLRKWREFAKEKIPHFREIYIRCPVEICMRREESREESFGAPSGIYQKAKEGWPVPGVNVPYEEPLNPLVIVDSDIISIKDGVKMIIDAIKRCKW
ncbi:MAG: adenylyl-sulfate kinase, partial [Thermodesulfovibrionales bacterium]|nr:adenylyl-sulfate kinase [Thermodesulfovibrionales bacterium]